MRKLWLTLLMMIIGVSNALATHYDIGPGEYFPNIGLFNNDTLLMTGGYGDSLSLSDTAIATIEGTDVQGIIAISLGGEGRVNFSGGQIGSIDAINKSLLNMTDGNINSIEMHSQSMSYLSGGQIGTLASDQNLLSPEPGGPLGWIQFYCREYNYDPGTRLLTGLWEDNSSFNINLLNIGTVPTYDHIEFHIVPEPATMLLFAVGGLLLRKRN